MLTQQMIDSAKAARQHLRNSPHRNDHSAATLLDWALTAVATPMTEQIEATVTAAVRAVWDWGESCGVDDVSFNEQGDSHNMNMRWKADTAVDAVYALFAAPSPGEKEPS